MSSRTVLPAVEYLADHLSGHGFKTAIHRIDVLGLPQANLVAWAGPPSPDGLIITGHLDTVPFEGQPGWERNPLQMEIDAERVYGRGSSDMKGFLAQCAEAARTLDKARLKRPVVFVITADEEVGMLGARELAPALQGLLGDIPRPSLAWIGEPTSYSVLHAHKSICSFEVRVRGRGGHSGTPHHGVNAIAVMARVIEALGRIQAELRAEQKPDVADVFPESPYDVMNLGTVRGGLATNVIAEECVLRASYRSLPSTDPLALFDEIKRRISAVDRHDFAGGELIADIETTVLLAAPSMWTERGSRLEKALFEVTGARTARGAQFATDGAWFSSVGIQCLICGPGDYNQAHQPNESIGREALERGPSIMTQVIERMCM